MLIFCAINKSRNVCQQRNYISFDLVLAAFCVRETRDKKRGVCFVFCYNFFCVDLFHDFF